MSATLYLRHGIRSVCFAPMIFRDEPLGLLVLYQDAVHVWTAEETTLARGFADQMATAVGNARLNDSVRSLAARLEAVQDLAIRLNRTPALAEIAGPDRRGHRAPDRPRLDPRLPRRPRDRLCEPIALRGIVPAARRRRILPRSGCADGQGLTGWAAAHNETVRSGDVARDPRVLRRLLTGETGVDPAAVPISFERSRPRRDRRLGRWGVDRFGADDETTLTIFAGYAAQAIVNATQLDLLDRQRSSSSTSSPASVACSRSTSG